MAQHAACELIVDLDALDRADKVLIPWRPPVVVDGEIVVHPAYVSPLDGQDVLHGGVVTDPAEIGRIRARVAHAELPALRRLVTRKPEGWR